MRLEHLVEAIRVTAQHHEGGSDVDQLICNALRGIIARARRYEANDTTHVEDDMNYTKQITAIVDERIQAYFKGL